MTGTTDTDLLGEFVARRCDAAFNELVRRYIDLVYSAAVRMVVDAHLAKDVTQRVFTALAQDAPVVLRKLGSGAPLSAWLHVTCRNIAAKTVRSEERRRAREKEATLMYESGVSESAGVWEQIAPHLDAALGSLRENDRSVLLLRFLEQKSLKEIAEILGAGESATQKRVSRALEALRKTLMRRGVNVSSGALAALLGANALQAAPASILAGIAATALGSTTVATSGAVATAKALGFLTMTKAQMTVTVGLLAGLGLPIAVQQSTLREIRAANAVRTEVAPLENPPEPATGYGARVSEDEELERLRQRAAAIRAQLSAEKTRTVSKEEVRSNSAPVLLMVGKSVSVFDLGYAGIASPEAALQSLLTFVRDGDLPGIMAVTALPPERFEEMNAALASEETREMLAERMQKGLLGVVVSESVQRLENGSTTEPTAREVWPENPTGTVKVEIVGIESLDQKRVRIRAHVLRGKNAKVENYTFGQTKSGWKHVWE